MRAESPGLSSLGIIAGNGTFPLLIAEKARARGTKVVAVAHRGETNPAIESLVSQCTWIKVGQLGKMVRFFQAAHVSDAVMAGGISRANLFSNFAPDWTAIRILAGLRRTTDDALLRRVAEVLETKGIRLRNALEFLDNSVFPSGYLTSRTLSTIEHSDALLGWEVAESLGKADVGQTVITSHGQVVAVEGLEGTDAAIVRAGELTAGASKAFGSMRLLKGQVGGAAGFVVVKRAKPGQDMRMDQPTIGLKTLETIKNAGGSALVIEAGRTLVIDSEKVIQFANSTGLSVLAVASPEELTAARS